MPSTVPAVLTALTALWTAAAPADFQVEEATLINVESDYLIVGWDDGDQPAVVGARSIADMGLGSDAETYDISNLLAVWLGGEDTPATARQRLFGFLDLFDTALTGSSRLGVTGVAVARVQDFAFAQPVKGEGPFVSLQFSVHVEAWK